MYSSRVTDESVAEGLTAEVLAALEQPEERVEARLKVRGVARYAADASMPGMLWSATLYSPLSHARITRIDAEKSQAHARVCTPC